MSGQQTTGVGSEWIEHRRGDGERIGWMLPRGDGFVAIDLLGRERTETVDWMTAEESLDELGIGYLADMYELVLDDGRPLRVRIAEVSPAGVRVKKDDFGAVGVPQLYFDVPFPVPATLRPLDPRRAHVIDFD